MPTEVALPEKTTTRAPAQIFRWILLAVSICAVVFLAIMAAKWPFTREAMIKRLERASSAQVEMRGFHSTYFPFPGCVAEDVVFRQKTSASGQKAPEPIITIRKLTIQSTFSGLLSKPGRIRRIIADGLRIHVPHEGANLHSEAGPNGDQTIIDELQADNALLELANGQNGENKLVFQIHHALFQNIGGRSAVPFQVSLHLPVPPGEVESSGSIGPWKDDKGTVRSTPISGKYALNHADLGVFKALGGIVSSRGEFSGNLERLNVSGVTDTPDFEVKESGHQFHLSAQFRGIVDMKNGDVVLPSLEARLGNTNLIAHGSVSGKPKTVALDVTHGQGEIQDLILLFSNAKTSPLLGPVVFQTQVVLPQEPRPFKERVRLTGNFNISRARFTSTNTQRDVDQLSERAEGKKDKEKDFDQDDDENGFERVMTYLKGNVVLTDGVARFSPVSFAVPGAEADMKGTYSLLSKGVDLKGKMRMLATVSQASTGAKSIFLKVLDPFYKKKKKGAGAEVPIRMTGTYGHTHFSAGLK
ncbi:MAG TPA: AsmA-like C-terminal region-containing protein [Candidatus Binatia bacterium]|nr:AsmA-like C-terminal region-containing protein [Candidatus Binatia bacterium]